MTDVAARNRRNRGAGKAWERAIRDGGRREGFDTEHTRDTGTLDEGDLVIRCAGKFVVIEAKNAAMQPGPFVEEALLEAQHFAQHRNLDPASVHPVAFVKRRGKADFMDGYALTTVREYLRLVKGGDS